MLTIGLLWHSVGSANLGVGALTYGQIALLEQAAARVGISLQFRLLGGGNPDKPSVLPNMASECHMSRGFFVPWKSPFIDHVRNCDIVMDIGEGDSFTDIYGGERYTYLTATKLLIRLVGRPLVLSPQTIGPFNRPLTRGLADFAMRRCRRVFARDHMSMQYLRERGIRNIDEAIDVAFALPYTAQEKREGGKTRVGINVSGLLYNGGYTRNNQFSLSLDYAALTHELLKLFTTHDDCEVFLVSHVVTDTQPVEDDLRICRQLAQQYPQVHCVDKFADPMAAKSFISGMDFFIGARMHACIAAFSSGVPVVPLAYSRKFNGLFESLNYRHFGDCKVATSEQIMALVTQAFDDRAELKRQVDSGNQMARQRLSRYENFLTDTLRELHDTKH